MNRVLKAGDTLKLPDKEFIIKDILGKGASSVTYLAEQGKTEHILKECNPLGIAMHRNETGELVADTDLSRKKFEECLERFNAGADKQLSFRLTEDLKNPTSNIQDIYYANGTAYIDMTYFGGKTYDKVDNETLYDLFRRMKALAQIVGHYHKLGYLHLDIKPQNIYTIPETPEMVMMFDFDSVTPIKDINAIISSSYTDVWAAPEQKMPKYRSQICEATDLFAIGEIIFFRLFGRHSEENDRYSFSRYEGFKDNKWFENVNPKVFPLITELLHKTLSCSAKKRYQNADQLVEKLDEITKFADPKEAYLVSSNIQLREDLCAYSEEVVAIRNIITNKSLVFLSGAADVSSQLAKSYAQMFRDDYSVILHMQYNGSLQALLMDDSCISIMNFDPTCAESEYIEEKMKKFADLCDKHVLLIVDNLSTHDFKKAENRYFDYFLRLKCDKIFTTPYDEWIYPVYRVGNFNKPFRVAKKITKYVGSLFVALAMFSIGLPVMSAEMKGELVYGTLTFKGFNLIEVSLLGWLVLLVPIALIFVVCDKRLKNTSKAMIICGSSALGLIGWVEGLMACLSFFHTAEDMGWPLVEYGWTIGVLSYVFIAIIHYIHYIGIDNMTRNMYYENCSNDDFEQETISSKISIYEKECDFSDIKTWCRNGLLEYFQSNLPNDSFYMAYFDNRSLIGVVEYRYLENEGVYLEMVEVCKQYRNRGYGRIIIELIQADVDYIECIPKDSDVVCFYKELGFVPCDNQRYRWSK